MNEDVFPIENGGFSNVMLVFQGVSPFQYLIFGAAAGTDFVKSVDDENSHRIFVGFQPPIDLSSIQNPGSLLFVGIMISHYKDFLLINQYNGMS